MDHTLGLGPIEDMNINAEVLKKAIANWEAAPASSERTSVIRSLKIRLTKVEKEA